MTIQAINVRNQFRGKVKAIIEGSVVSEVDVETPAGIVTSVITTRSVKDLGQGDRSLDCQTLIAHRTVGSHR